jgi:peptidoglycan/LPS O-acetylase OafA/YrhL
MLNRTPEEAKVVVRQDRLLGLDLVRGLCALAVMAYHYTYLAGDGALLGFGTFGVYIFFALSGFALFYVYGDRPISERFLRDFYMSRIFRIFPLFLAVAIYRSWGSEFHPYHLMRLIVHATPLAGVADPTAFTLVVGGWSVLVEWSFYLLFPALLLFRSTTALAALFVFTVVVNYLYVMGAYYPPENVRAGREFDYSDTMTFLCFFVGGMLGGHIYSSRPDLMRLVSSLPYPLICSLLVMAVIFAWPEVIQYPARREFLSGPNATVLVFLSCLVVFLAALENPVGWAGRISVFLGDISFALYLIHVYVWNWIGKVFAPENVWLHSIVAGLATIILAKAIHFGFENPLRNIRKLPSLQQKAGHN